MVKILIILVVVLALIGGGVFGVSQFAPRMLPVPVLEILGVEPPPPEEKKVVRLTPQETALIDLEPLTIPLIRDGEVDRFLIMHILIEVESGPNQELVNKNLLRIIDAVIIYVHAFAALDIKPGLDDRAFLKARLIVKIEEIVGEGVVENLLFQNIFERPFK
ncbi:MAG: hypothetical protein HOL85_09630 [Rhodospirillaceae bacterium]|nr:hypothetical protein [Rhodospirillaceae bacterium]MBT6136381.1 hypothetical protein [Rhodospirillaceae bacterium]